MCSHTGVLRAQTVPRDRRVVSATPDTSSPPIRFLSGQSKPETVLNAPTGAAGLGAAGATTDAGFPGIFRQRIPQQAGTRSKQALNTNSKSDEFILDDLGKRT